MPVHAGDSLLHYRILDKIGEGGMGEVWRARDTTLDRDVAIKVLPQAVAADAERVGRFEREAKTLASLTHPGIAAIHGLHEHDGTRFLAMEFVPGEDLAARLARGVLPPDEALPAARQIADALEYAHEHGIVHRDLKPANVKVLPDGDVKVLDFGLAKAIAGGPETGVTGGDAATLTSPAMTAMGMILGTAAYMSPEQARGRPVDRRADNWAFGCVLYEMLTGARPFDGDTVTDVLAAVVTREPDWTRVPAATPPAVRHLLRRCLDKDPRTRLRDIGEARIVLADPGAADVTAATSTHAGAAPRRGGWWIGAAAALAAGALAGRFVWAPTPPPPPSFEFDVTMPGSSIDFASFALSPDGARLVFVARDEAGERRLAVRDMQTIEARLLPGTRGAAHPFWSLDGREVAYFADNQLYRMALDAAAPRLIATIRDPRGGAWAPGDIILIGSGTGPIRKVPASGGADPVPITTVETGVETAHVWPALLPDGRRFVFLADASSEEGHRIRLGSLDGGETTILRSRVRSQPVLDPDGRLLIADRGQLVAYPFDLKTATLGADATLLASPVHPLGSNHELPASAAPFGMLAFQHTSADSRIVFLDQAGRVTRTVGDPERFANVRVSPDGKRLGFEILSDSDEQLVSVLDLERGVRTTVSQRGARADSATWSPRGETVYFNADPGDSWEVYRMSVTGGGAPERIGKPEGAVEAAIFDISPDGRWLVAGVMQSAGRYDLHLVGLQDAERKWTPWLVSPAQDFAASFSPDSRWLAYSSDASGRNEVYLAPLEGGPSHQRWQMSSGGGFEPRFSPDGRTLYYRSPGFEWMAVPLRFSAGGVEAGAPKALFSMPPMELPYVRNFMDVLPDGSGFVSIRPVSGQSLAIRVRTGK